MGGGTSKTSEIVKAEDFNQFSLSDDSFFGHKSSRPKRRRKSHSRPTGPRPGTGGVPGGEVASEEKERGQEGGHISGDNEEPRMNRMRGGVHEGTANRMDRANLWQFDILKLFFM